MIQLEQRHQSAWQNISNPSAKHLQPLPRNTNQRPPGRGRNTHPGSSNRGGHGLYGRGCAYQLQQSAGTQQYTGISYHP